MDDCPKVVSSFGRPASCLIAVVLHNDLMTVLIPAIDNRPTDEILAGTEISVIVPAWNGHERLPVSIQQIVQFLEQQQNFTELILVDDHSSPPLETVVDFEHLNGHNTRVMTRLIHNSDPRGKGHAVASGLLRAIGQYQAMSMRS